MQIVIEHAKDMLTYTDSIEGLYGRQDRYVTYTDSIEGLYGRQERYVTYIDSIEGL